MNPDPSRAGLTPAERARQDIENRINSLEGPPSLRPINDQIQQMLTDAGAVGAIGNRRAFRVAVEPLDLFRRYCAVYAREQASCHFSPALIRNLEQNWGAGARSG